eukprot:Skav216121  [mRNA]  locus=scaffold1946:231474:232733:- [translate_table: standard]
MSNGHVRPAASIVRLQLQSLVIGHNCLFALARVCQGGSKLVPDGVIIWTQSASSCECLNRSVEISINVFHHAQGDKNVWIVGTGQRGPLKELGHLSAPGFVFKLWRRLNAL